MQEKLMAIRRMYNVSQKEMAELIGVDWRTYVNKEKGVSQFKSNEMFIIAHRFNKGIGEIFLPTDFMNHEEKLKGVK